MGDVSIVSRRMIRPEPTTSPPETIHLTPWDLRMITVDHIQKGVLLPKPPTTGGQGRLHAAAVVEHLASSFERALGRFYPFAGRLAATPGRSDCDGGSPKSLVVSLRCSGEGAEFVHAVAPGVTVADLTAAVSVPRVVWSFFPLDGMLGVDSIADSLPVMAAQVTELADGMFVALSLNHGVADGTAFWRFFNTWSEISRCIIDGDGGCEVSSPLPVHRRWFLDGCPVPIPLPFGSVEEIVGQRLGSYPPVQECFLHFSAESVKKLKAKANAEMSGIATATISSLQALLAHLWRAACRARRLAPGQETMYSLLVGCRGRVDGVPTAYLGNAVAHAAAQSPAGEILDRGLGWAAWLLNRAVASFDERSLREKLASWPGEPSFPSMAAFSATAHTSLLTGSSPRFDVYGNDFGWGRPVTVRSGAGNKLDGKVTVYEGGDGAGSMALEVCLAPEALARLVADDEFMAAVGATHR
ncbi:hypothetical protein QYE76_033617 [Lolium multiflorum]|uniref:Acetyltransferase n=1 Tax=Lolium multiflorum TaxID=4521 RepID=A0AAD8QZ13_LOLMU|nr:hypothetical protein QYE76_033617 [Lolium multiflorum]